jgi:cytochrome b6-f complex iron-sulfur subunit
MADEEAPQAEAPKEEPTDKAVVAAGGGRQVAAAGAGAPALVVVPMPSPGLTAPKVERRRVLQIGFWSAFLVALGGISATIINFMYPRGLAGFGSAIAVGTLDQLPEGGFLRNLDARTWVMRMSADQAEREGAPQGSIIALYHKCPHLGCTVPWQPGFPFADPRNDNATYQGWFRCPCHGSTYSATGVRVFGPAPRSLDVFALSIDDGGNIIVDTGTITQGSPDNPSHAILPS